jgi:hypothetical protein
MTSVVRGVTVQWPLLAPHPIDATSLTPAIQAEERDLEQMRMEGEQEELAAE